MSLKSDKTLESGHHKSSTFLISFVLYAFDGWLWVGVSGTFYLKCIIFHLMIFTIISLSMYIICLILKLVVLYIVGKGEYYIHLFHRDVRCNYQELMPNVTSNWVAYLITLFLVQYLAIWKVESRGCTRYDTNNN